MTKKKYLTAKVWCVLWLQRLKLIPKTWRKCELDLAELKAEKMLQAFEKIEKEM